LLNFSKAVTRLLTIREQAGRVHASC